MKNVIGFFIGLIVATGIVVSMAQQVKYQTGDYTVGQTVMYGVQSNGTLTPILVNASGAIKTY